MTPTPAEFGRNRLATLKKVVLQMRLSFGRRLEKAPKITRIGNQSGVLLNLYLNSQTGNIMSNITKYIEFSHNWNNKLSCTAFTTLRLSDRFGVGDRVEVYMNKRKLGTVEIVQKYKTEFGKISDSIAYLDTGYNADECRKILQTMYKDIVLTSVQVVYLYLCVYVQKTEATAVQGNLFDS